MHYHKDKINLIQLHRAAKMETEEQQLIFIPGPGIGHIVSAVEIGKLIVTGDTRLSITFLLLNDAEVREYTHSQPSLTNPRLRFLNLPELETQPSSITDYIDSHIPLVREAVLHITKLKTPVSGFIIDMFCVNMLDLADEFRIPSYTFFTSSTGFLSLILRIQKLTDENGLDVTEYRKTDQEFQIPGFTHPVPAKVLPSPMLDKNGGSELVMHTARMIRRTRGIFVNTFEELESNVVKSLCNSDDIPPIYPIGPLIGQVEVTNRTIPIKSPIGEVGVTNRTIPIESLIGQSEVTDRTIVQGLKARLLNPKIESGSDGDEIIRWLDRQPTDSVVFLCFGSKGSFSEAQIKHLACALESSGYRFLWSLRARNRADNPSLDEILPEGFLERISEVGKVVGWVPQAAVLSHAAVGGFVSHCGWNSILESLYFGVPIAAWPIYAEQQVNAFQMVVELGMAVEIRMDYREDDEIVVSSEEIERAIKKLMEEDGDGMREKVKDVREKSLRALTEGGSSHRFLGCLVHDILSNSLT